MVIACRRPRNGPVASIAASEHADRYSNKTKRDVRAMSIKDFLSPDHVSVDVRVSEKTKLLRELARQAALAIDVPADRIFAELHKREELGSTGTGGGVAIPHARLPEVKKPFGMLVRLAQPIQFEAIDDRPVDLVFLLLLPAASAGEQLNALAAVARRLRQPNAVRDLRQATDASSCYHTMTVPSQSK